MDIRILILLTLWLPQSQAEVTLRPTSPRRP